MGRAYKPLLPEKTIAQSILRAWRFLQSINKSPYFNYIQYYWIDSLGEFTFFSFIGIDPNPYFANPFLKKQLRMFSWIITDVAFELSNFLQRLFFRKPRISSV